MDDRIRVVLAEDEATLRRSLMESLRAQPDMLVLGDAENGRALLRLCKQAQPDIAVLDIRMPVMDGMEAARELRGQMPDIRLLILTTFDDEEYLRVLFGLGIDGYLLKADCLSLLPDAVRNVHRGMGMVDRRVSRKLGLLLAQANNMPQDVDLTETERQAAELIAKGFYNKDIAKTMNISYGRTRNLVSTIYRKLDVVDRKDLIRKLGKG